MYSDMERICLGIIDTRERFTIAIERLEASIVRKNTTIANLRIRIQEMRVGEIMLIARLAEAETTLAKAKRTIKDYERMLMFDE